MEGIAEYKVGAADLSRRPLAVKLYYYWPSTGSCIMGVLAYAIPPLGGRKHGQFDQFLRFSESLEFHSHVCLHALNKLTSIISTSTDPLQGRAEWGCSRTPSPR